ncbi:unnamed protein product [Rotaria magnacalcarata]|uniref:Uncharacterized protein n=1 Tax=Rotaria magnacalcarata TaxID=392030 RepID=A0A816U2Q6_9BILA|nr:unnamed protein product [Rotaria magnacalcarata]CAF3996443.1 unnamed protein product [Rotaria magnacalcarata]
MNYSEDESTQNTTQFQEVKCENKKPTNEIEFEEETCDRLNDELSSRFILNTEQTKIPSQDNYIVYNEESTNLDSIITDILNDCLTTETLAKNSQTSLLKLDKTTSTHFVLPNLNKQSNVSNDFYTDLFSFEKNTSIDSNLGKDEHWIVNTSASYYVHPFHIH